jgi:hypothetical protein
MSNHMHVLVHVDEQQVMAWTYSDVAQRWHRLNKGTLLT